MSMPFSFLQSYVFLLESAATPDDRFFAEVELLTLDNAGNIQYKLNIVKGESNESYNRRVAVSVVVSKDLGCYSLPEFHVKLPKEITDLISDPARCINAYKLIRGI